MGLTTEPRAGRRLRFTTPPTAVRHHSCSHRRLTSFLSPPPPSLTPPSALMTAELSIAFPEAAGFSAWANSAYGPYVSFLCR